jgi:hypothetical protein
MAAAQMWERFNVTFETITPESAEHGDTATAGFIAEGVTLREAIEAVGWGNGGCVADECPVTDPRSLTMYRVCEDYATAEIENRSLHFPESVTAASRVRIARMLGCYGVPAL